MKYGDRLRSARKHKNLTQPELAKKSGVGQGSISKIERGDQEYSAYDIELAQALDINPIWLKTGNTKYAPEWLLEPIQAQADFIEGEVIRRDLPSPEDNTEQLRPPIIGEDEWKTLPPKVRALIEEMITKTSSGDLTDSHVKIIHNMVDELSKK